MAFLSVQNVNILGIAACVPKNSENNLDYDWIPVKDRELLIKTTGIEKKKSGHKWFVYIRYVF